MVINPRFVCIGALLLLLSGSAIASQDEPVAIQGFKDMSCGAWAASSGNVQGRAEYLDWVRGFISGVNFVDRHNQMFYGQTVSNDTLTLYIDKYCKDHPLNSFAGAAFQLARELRAPSKQS